MIIVVQSLDMVLKHRDVARKGYDVKNRGQVSRDIRIATNSQIILIQVFIDLISSRSPDRRCYLRAEVNAVSTNSTIIGIHQLTSSRSPKIAERLI